MFPARCDIGGREIEEIVPDLAGVEGEAADRAVSP
jgi:hypothetical protein